MSARRSVPGGIRLAAFDVDGVFTDGRFYLDDNGTESKAFFTQDGYGIRMLLQTAIQVTVISGRTSLAVARRMSELGVEHLIQGCNDKVAALSDVCGRLGITMQECLYVGDDIPDLPLLDAVGFSVAVANAVPAVRDVCDYTTSAAGGFGAVREVCELLLASKVPAG